MSKMSQLHAELTEQAAELGFESIQDAEDHGYEVISTGDWAKLVKSETDEEEAHKAWLKEKEEAIRRLELTLENVDVDDVENVENAIEFIKGIKYES